MLELLLELSERLPISPSVLVALVHVTHIAVILLCGLEDDDPRVVGVLEDFLESDRVVESLLRANSLVEAEVVVALLQGVEGDVTVELAQGMRL